METIALLAHVSMRDKLIRWAKENDELLKEYNIITTADTQLGEFLRQPITTTKPLMDCGDLRIASGIMTGTIKRVVFFWNFMDPNQYSGKIILNAALSEDAPIALNESSAVSILQSGKNNAWESIKDSVITPTANSVLHGAIEAIMEDLTTEHAILIEKYQSGFTSILGTLTDKVMKKITGNYSKEEVEETLASILDKNNELSDEQKNEVESLMMHILGQESYMRAIIKHLDGDSEVSNTITTAIKKVKQNINGDHIADVVKWKLESYKDDREKIEEALKKIDDAKKVDKEE